MEPSNQPKETENSEKVKQITNMKSLSFALQFGLMIVIPLLVLAYTGKWLASRYDSQIFFYGGLILAILISTVWFYKKINDLYNDFIDKDSDK